jgi:hypothetical protein
MQPCLERTNKSLVRNNLIERNSISYSTKPRSTAASIVKCANFQWALIQSFAYHDELAGAAFQRLWALKEVCSVEEDFF